MKGPCKADLPALLFLFALLLLWQAAAAGMDAAYTLPSPLQIIQKLWELRVLLFTVHLPATMTVTALGLAFSLALGLALAVAMDASGLVRRVLYPLVVVSQTIPTTAIAPLFVLWFGYGIWSKVLVTVLITFFPITITVYVSQAPSLDDLYVAWAAFLFGIFRRVCFQVPLSAALLHFAERIYNGIAASCAATETAIMAGMLISYSTPKSQLPRNQNTPKEHSKIP